MWKEHEIDFFGGDGSDDKITVNGEKLWDFIESMETSKHELLKDYILAITRQFDERVKSFIKNILMGPGKDKIAISHYSYRVEFQARGNYTTNLQVFLFE